MTSYANSISYQPYVADSTYVNTNWSNPVVSSPYIDFSSKSDSVSSEVSSVEEWEKRAKKESEEQAKKVEEEATALRLEREKREMIKEIEKKSDIKATEERAAQIKENKKADGSSTVRVPYKKLGFWQKAARWLSNAGTAIVNMGDQLLGKQPDGTRNWGKAALNIGIATACIAACFIPYVGPAIGYGLAAYGLGTGVYGVAKGIKNYNKALASGDDEAIDNAQQEICGSAFIGITSACGLKGMRGVGKSFRVKAASTPKGASIAKVRTSTLGKAWENTSQFTRDFTVNTWRAERAAVKQNGFFGAYKQNVVNAYRNIADFKTRFNNQKAHLENTFNEQIARLESIPKGSRTASQRAQLKLYKDTLKQLESAKTQVDYQNIIDGLSKSGLKQTLDRLNIAHTDKTYKLIAKDLKKSGTRKLIQNEVKKLAKEKECYMRNLAKNDPEGSKAILDEYTQAGIRNSRSKVASNSKAAQKHVETLEKNIVKQKELLVKHNEELASLRKELASFKKELSSLKEAAKAAKDKKAMNKAQKLVDAQTKKINAQTKKINAQTKKIADLKNDIKSNTNELGIYKNMEFKSWTDMSSWGKNDYQLAIGGTNPGSTRKFLALTLTHPAGSIPKSMYVFDPVYSAPFFFGEDYTAEEVKQELKNAEEAKKANDKAVESINGIKDTKKWEDFKKIEAETAKQAEKQAQEAQQKQSA